MDNGDPETKGRQAIVDLPRRWSKRGRQDTNRARTTEGMEETQEAGLHPTQEVETGNNVRVQEVEEVELAPLHRADSVKIVKVKNVEEVQ